jgi:hypothetical protein
VVCFQEETSPRPDQILPLVTNRHHGSFPVLERPEREARLLLLFNLKVNKTWSCTSIPRSVFKTYCLGTERNLALPVPN